MKLLSFSFLFLFLVECCNKEQKVQSCLERAQDLYENDQYNSAKHVLDSLNIFASSKGALLLMRNIEWKEQERNVIFCDSLLRIRQLEADSMKSYFTFIKSEYDRTGKYIDKSWSPEVEEGYDFIKTSIDETNCLSFTVVHKGDFVGKYNQVKVSIANGEYAETQVLPFDEGANYTFPDNMGNYYEILTYQNGRDNGVVHFIYTNFNDKIVIKCLGGKRFIPSRILSSKEKRALVRTVDFASILIDIDKWKTEKAKARKRMEYLQSKIGLFPLEYTVKYKNE